MTYICLMLEFNELDIGMSIKRYLPPYEMAGLLWLRVSGCRRGPLPPASIILATLICLSLI